EMLTRERFDCVGGLGYRDVVVEPGRVLGEDAGVVSAVIATGPLLDDLLVHVEHLLPTPWGGALAFDWERMKSSLAELQTPRRDIGHALPPRCAPKTKSAQ